jgi:hypothetical protein
VGQRGLRSFSSPLVYLHNLNQTPPPQTGTIQHATAAKVAVFTCALDIAQTETEGTALTKNVDKPTRGKEEHLAKVRCFDKIVTKS